MPEDKEITLKKNFFSAQKELRSFLCHKYWKYNGKPIQLKRHLYPLQPKDERIGFYIHNQMPTFINDARIHLVSLGKNEYVLCEDEFEIYKKKIKDKDGNFVHYVDVKCSHCSHIGSYNMRYLVWKLNCEKCRNTITVDDRVKKEKFNMSDFR